MTPVDVAITVLLGVVLLAVLGVLVSAVYFVVAADREPLDDEISTLDVQNHHGDTRPLR